MRVLLAIICISIIFASCNEDKPTQPEVDKPTQPIADPYDRWKSFDLHNYTIDQAVHCFCENGSQTMELNIVSDTIASGIRKSDGIYLPYSVYSKYLPIDSLFALIKYCKDSQDSLVVQYNEKYGFPEILDINPHLHPVDGGVLYVTGNLH